MLYYTSMIKKYLVQVALECATGKTFDPESVGKCLIYKIMLLHLGARTLSPLDLHIH